MLYKHRSSVPLLSSLLCVTLLSACTLTGESASATTEQSVATVVAGATTAPTAVATVTATTTTSGVIETRLSGTGNLRAIRTVDLAFPVAGRVAEVLVEEGDTVKQGQLLAVLDTRPFDNTIAQSEADLRAAYAAQESLTEAPNAADVQVANANVQQAEIAVAQAQNLKTQDVAQSEAAIATAQQNLETTRNTLSAAKTEAELQLKQASGLLIQAQANYSQAKTNWEYVHSTGKLPVNTSVDVTVGVDIPTVGPVDVGDLTTTDRKATDAEQQAIYNQYVAAEAAMHNAEQGVNQAQVAYDLARQNEVTGIAQAEQQVVLAQSELVKVQGPPDQDSVAAAETNLVAAQGVRKRLDPAPKASSKEIASANISRAEATLNQAKLSREYAELYAPFDGIVSSIGAQAGEMTGPVPLSSGTSLLPQAAMTMIDTSAIRFEVAVNEADIGRVSIGQRAEIWLDAFPDQQLTGTVNYIAPIATQTGNIRTYTVRVQLDQQEGLRDGMSGRISLLTNP